MIVLSWNCRGLGNPRAIPVLRELIRTHTPDIIFLFETLVHAQKLEDIRIKIGYEGCFAVNRDGRSGGIGVLWRRSSTCSLMSFSNNHVYMEIVNTTTGGWRLTGFYGFPERNRRRDSWNLLRTIAAASTLPWCIIGDFNDLLHSEDKRGRVEHPEWLFNGFRTAVNDCALQEISMQGYQFTWSRSRGKPNAVEERLDRAFGNSEWLALFPNAQVNNLIAAISDHSPLLLRTIQPEVVPQKRKFRFENKWLREPDFKEVVRNSWDAGSGQDLLPRLEICSELLSNWGKQRFASFKRNINHYKKKMEQLRHCLDHDSVEEYEAIRKNMIDLIVQEEDHWRQRAKSFWLSEGDLNTKFFHANANARRRRNQITRLQDGNGIWCEDKTSISQIVVQYFADLYSESNGNYDPVIDVINTTILEEDNEMLLAPYTLEEFKDAVFQMHPDKSPEPDGFIQRSIKNSGIFWGRMYIIIAKDGWSRIMAKVIANRLKKILPKVISSSQSAFVQGRTITDNILVAFEILHHMKRKTKGKMGGVALKVDISKAYDRVDWGYLKGILIKMGFNIRWVQLIMQCVTSAQYSILLNDQSVGPVQPQRGLRQGDPLSPYLFILCAEGLSALIQRAEAHGSLHGYKVCRGAPIVSHLFFADDSFFFFRSTTEETTIMKNILTTYQEASGQAINFGKSGIFYSGNVHQEVKNKISSILGVNSPLDTGRYLGLPSLIGRSKKMVFSYLKERIWKRIQSWRNKPLSKAGKEILIKAVAQAIPSYCMNVFLLPVSIAEEIQRMLNSFWWGSKKDNQRCINWLSWDRLSVRKEEGGLGFRDLYGFNLAMLGRQGWSFISNPDTLASRIFKAKYFTRGDFLTAQLGHNPSFVWKSIWSSQSLLQVGCRWKIGDGTKINIWSDPWLRETNNFRVQTEMISGMESLRVAELMLPGRKQWDIELLNQLFNARDKCEILKIPLREASMADIRIWHYSKNGRYTVKSGYWVVSEVMSSNIARRTPGEWKKVWNLMIPPKVKTFLWRAIRDCLPVRATLQRKGISVPITCVHCNDHIENTWHAFLLCPLAQECWNESHLSHIINSCAAKVDSFAEMILLMMTTLTNTEVGKAVMIMWGLWKQRNEKLWNNKHCTSSQLVREALEIMYNWLQAKERGPIVKPIMQRTNPICKRWHKPPPHFLKCNTDAAIFTNKNAFGLSSVLRDENGEFMACRVQHDLGNPMVKECEVLALINAITWVKEMNLTNVIFELDAKNVVDAINSPVDDATEFGSLVNQCKLLLNQGTAFSVQFAYRQANCVADALAKAAQLYASPSIFLDSPPNLIAHLDDYCNSLHD